MDQENAPRVLVLPLPKTYAGLMPGVHPLAHKTIWVSSCPLLWWRDALDCISSGEEDSSPLHTHKPPSIIGAKCAARLCDVSGLRVDLLL